jgi:cytosine/creatinine deaminase
MTNVDICIRNARLRRSADQLVDIAVAGGRIVALGHALAVMGRDEIDAGGNLVTESFVNPHLHLCKVWTLPMMAEEALTSYRGDGMTNTLSAIDLASKIKESYDTAWITGNARCAVALAALHGTTHIRAFADVDRKARLEGVKALLAVREEFRGIVDLQVVAFAQDGIVREPGADRLMREAMELGADVVGGIPWIESGVEDAQAHIRFCFALAAQFGKDVSMLLDDIGDPSMHTLEMMAAEAIERGWQGRALAHHCRAMALYPMAAFDTLVELMRRARVTIISDPHTGPLHARVQELLAAGINVALGQDDISDAYYPFGRNNMLEVAFLAAHLLWMTARAEIEALYDMITVTPARAINIADFGLAIGTAANIVVLAQADVVDALRFHEVPYCIVSHGRLVDLARMRQLASPKYPVALQRSRWSP